MVKFKQNFSIIALFESKNMEKTKLKDVLALCALAYARAFSAKFGEQEIAAMPSQWVFATNSEHGVLGRDFWAKFKDCPNSSQISSDFDNLSHKFQLDFFGRLSDEKVEKFYADVKFKPPFAGLKSTHAANIFVLLGSALRQDENERSHAVLGAILGWICLPSATLLAKTLINEAKSDYYVAVGHFMLDFFGFIKLNLGLKADFE